VAGACVVALFMGALGQAFGGFGQELFNAAILAAAVVMLAWHNVWMAGHGKQMADSLFAAGRNALTGSSTPLALAFVVGAAVMREGAEVVLFLMGIAASDDGGLGGMAAGGALGLALGAAVSALTYFGLLRIPQRHLFAVTGWLIAFLAAGMAAQAAAYLQSAGVIDVMRQTLWNSSWLLRESSIPGRILHTLVGYDDRPTLLQPVAYVGTLAAIVLLTRRARQSKSASPAKAATLGAPAE
jgi:high-affinity iron transporter